MILVMYQLLVGATAMAATYVAEAGAGFSRWAAFGVGLLVLGVGAWAEASL
jgi:hypothetical protein